MLRQTSSVDVDHSDKTKHALAAEEIAGQTAIFLIAGQDTTVPGPFERCRRLMVSYF
jgi:chorismate mutase